MTRRRQTSDPSSSVADTTDLPGDDDPVPPFFNTTFSTHRVSPLYVGAEKLTSARLAVLGRRLRDTLVGDVVRGIQIGLEATETPAGQVGPLKSVALRWFRANTVLGDEVDYAGSGGGGPDDVWDALSQSQKQGLWIEIRHENAAYVAVLLPGVNGATASKAPAWRMQPGQASYQAEIGDESFVHLPLMLLRMPLALKSVISEWLSNTFDCRVSRLALGSRTIVGVWEDWIRTVGVSPKGPDFVITLGFNAPLPDPIAPGDGGSDEESDAADSTQPGLRSLEITIQPQELSRFVRAGTAQARRPGRTGASWDNDPRERRRLAGGNTDDGWEWLARIDSEEQPFMDALARYLDHHLALNLFHPSVKVIQVSCGGFVLASSRLKIIWHGEMTDDMSRAAWMFVTRLGHRVKGENLPTIFT